jgi:outer membrane protein
MKNLSLALNIVLTIAVVILYVLHFKGGNKKGENSLLTNEKLEGKLANGNLKILYVNTDSLWNNFAMVKEIEDDLILEKNKMETQFRSKVQKLEKEMIDFQTKAEKGLLDINTAQAQEQDLMQKQQNLMNEKDDLAMRLMNKEKEYNEKIQNEIYSYLKKMNEENPLDFVLGYTAGSGSLLYANDSLDVTDKIIKALNESYNKTEKK